MRSSDLHQRAWHGQAYRVTAATSMAPLGSSAPTTTPCTLADLQNCWGRRKASSASSARAGFADIRGDGGANLNIVQHDTHFVTRIAKVAASAWPCVPSPVPKNVRPSPLHGQSRAAAAYRGRTRTMSLHEPRALKASRTASIMPKTRASRRRGSGNWLALDQLLQPRRSRRAWAGRRAALYQVGTELDALAAGLHVGSAVRIVASVSFCLAQQRRQTRYIVPQPL